MNAYAISYNYLENKTWSVKCKIDDEIVEINCKQIIFSSFKRGSFKHNPNLSSKDDSKLLKYRDFITVAVMFDCKLEVEDNWIYLHDPEIKAGRLQNFASWSPEMIDQNKECACVGLEYFCNQGDNFWQSSDTQILEIAKMI